MDTLGQILDNLWTSAYVQQNPTKSYKSQYNAEYTAIAQYISGGARPDPANYSKMGKVLVGIEDQKRAAVVIPDPPPVDPPPPNTTWGTALRSRFPTINATTIVDDTGKPDRTSALVYDGAGYHDILLKHVTRREGSGDGFKLAGGATRIELRLCNAYNPGPNDAKPQLLNFQRGPKQIQIYGGEFAEVGHDKYAHFSYMGADSTDILMAGCLARDMYGYGLHGYPGPGSGVATNCTIIGSKLRNGAVVYPGFDLYVVNSIMAHNAIDGINDQGGTWKFENCCIWPKPSSSTDARFVNCIFEDPMLDGNHKPQNPKLADGGKADWMAPHDYKGNAYTKKSIGAAAV